MIRGQVLRFTREFERSTVDGTIYFVDENDDLLSFLFLSEFVRIRVRNGKLLLMENVLFALILLFLKTLRNDFFFTKIFNIFSLPLQRDERSKITFKCSFSKVIIKVNDFFLYLKATFLTFYYIMFIILILSRNEKIWNKKESDQFIFVSIWL